MSESRNHNLYRVKIQLSNDHVAIGTSFEPEYVLSEDKQILKNLLDLSDEWTSYCISALAHMPELAQLGQGIAAHIIKESFVPFLDEVSVGREVREFSKNESTEHRYVIHEEDVQMVLGKIETARSIIRASKALERSALAGVIGEFEFFLSRFLKIVASHNPSAFYSLDEKISIGRIVDKGSAKEVISDIIEKKN